MLGGTWGRRGGCSAGQVPEGHWRFLGLSQAKLWLPWDSFAGGPAVLGGQLLSCWQLFGSAALQWEVLLWLCWKKVQWLFEIAFWSDFFIWEALVPLYFSFERWRSASTGSRVEDPKHYPSKQPLLHSAQWEPQGFSFNVTPPRQKAHVKASGKIFPRATGDETNQVQLLAVLLFGVAAVSCTSELWQGLHTFSSIWHLSVSDVPRDQIGVTALKTLEEMANSSFRAGIKLCSIKKSKIVNNC